MASTIQHIKAISNWDEKDEATLEELYDAYQTSHNRFSLIMKQYMGNKNQQPQQIVKKKIGRPKQNGKIQERHQWTKEEDEIIRQGVQTVGKNWKMIRQMGLYQRTCKQIREHWTNKLDPRLFKQFWSKRDVALLIELQKKLGSKWTQMSRYFCGRSGDSLKNKFNSLINNKNGLPQIEKEILDKLQQEFPIIRNVSQVTVMNMEEQWDYQSMLQEDLMMFSQEAQAPDSQYQDEIEIE